MATLALYDTSNNWDMLDSTTITGAAGGADFDGRNLYSANGSYIQKQQWDTDGSSFTVNSVELWNVQNILAPTGTAYEPWAICIGSRHGYYAYSYNISVGTPPAIQLKYQIARFSLDFNYIEDVTSIAGTHAAANPVIDMTMIDDTYLICHTRGTGSGTVRFVQIYIKGRAGEIQVRNQTFAQALRLRGIAWNGYFYDSAARTGAALILDAERNILDVGPVLNANLYCMFNAKRYMGAAKRGVSTSFLDARYGKSWVAGIY
jgi:hypothetical protein